MQNIGQAWLVLQLTHSAFKLGMVSAVQFLPMMFLSLFAGALADRFPKKKVLLFTQASLMVLAAILASLTFFNVVQYWHVLILAFLLGLVNTLDMPTRQAFFIDLVGKEDLMNAIALNSTIFNLARIIGPAIAGLLIGLVGIALCFYLNALSFIAVLIGLWLIQVPVTVSIPATKENSPNLLSTIKEGLNYIIAKPIIYLPLALMAAISIFVINLNVFVPLLAKQNLNQNAMGFGLLMTAMGIGSLSGALTIATKSKIGPKLPVILAGAFGMSLFLIVLGYMHNYILACLTLFAIGFCMISFTTSINSILQLNSDDGMRGRVMSLYSLVFGGMTPIGSLFAGKVIELTGVSFGLLICGLCGLASLGVIYIFYRRKLASVQTRVISHQA